MPLQICGGIDPAFSTGGDNCIVRLAILGQEVSGQIVLDFMGERLLFKIPVLASLGDAAEMQVSEGIVKVLKQHHCPLEHCALDVTGVGRALGELVRMKGGYSGQPLRILTIPSGKKSVKSFDVQPMEPLKLWAAYRDFIQHDQIRGLDQRTLYQLTSRLTEWKNNKEILEGKQAYRRRIAAINPAFAHSPDEADAGALCLQAAIVKLAFSPGQRREMPQNVDEGYRKLAAHDLQQYREAEKARKEYVPLANFNQELVTGAPYMNMPFSREEQ
jgi:hypothetical protein